MPLPSVFTAVSAGIVLVAGIGAGVGTLSGPDHEPALSQHAVRVARPPQHPSPARSGGHKQQGPAAASTAAHAPDQPSNNSHAAVPRIPTTPVVVLNNSHVWRLAHQQAALLSRSGWNVAQIGNWAYPVMPATTVFYPPGLRSQGGQLAAVLHATRTARSFAPMQPAALTVILAGQ